MGKHTSLYYGSEENLFEFVVSFFEEGLKNNMSCVWVVPQSLGVERAKTTLGERIKDLNLYIEKGQFELLSHEDTYLKGGAFNPDEVLGLLVQKEQDVLKHGFNGLQVSGDASWLQTEDWIKFVGYEETMNKIIPQKKIVALCTFPIQSFDVSRMFSLSFSHDTCVRRSNGITDIIKFWDPARK